MMGVAVPRAPVRVGQGKGHSRSIYQGAGDVGAESYLAMSFLVRIPFRPLPLSSMLAVTRSILDMIFSHGTSRLTIADMAESTPL